MTKLKGYSKEDLIDIVHSAKCGKLQGLDTSKLSKDEIVKHLIESKCPEVHSMIVELEEVKGDVMDFVSEYLKDGKKITKEHIYFTGIQPLITPAFLIEAVEKKRYDCILKFKGAYKSYLLNLFPFSGQKGEDYNFNFTSEVDEILKKLAEDMEKCIKNGSKLIAIPISQHAHANIILYRVAENTFERYEPHGKETGLSAVSLEGARLQGEITTLRYNIEKRVEKIMDLLGSEDNVAKYNDKLENVDYIKPTAKAYNKAIKELVKLKNELENFEFKDKVREKKERRIAELELETTTLRSKLSQEMEGTISGSPQVLLNWFPKKRGLYEDRLVADLEFIKMSNKTIALSLKEIMDNKLNQRENVNKRVNDAMKYVFTSKLAKLNPRFDGAKYVAPDLLVVAEDGLQSVEPKQLRKSRKMTQEEYENRVGGFCLLWSILYLDTVFRFPDMSYKKINKALLQLLRKEGEDGFANLALGFLEKLKRTINKKIKGIDYTKFTEASDKEREQMLLPLNDELKKQYDI